MKDLSRKHDYFTIALFLIIIAGCFIIEPMEVINKVNALISLIALAAMYILGCLYIIYHD